MRKSLVLLLPMGLWMASAQSLQSPVSGAPPAKKEGFKNVAPVSKEVLKVKLPKAQETVLDNGMTVLILEDHRLPQISISMSIRGGGGLLDPPELKGLSLMASALMREGTASMTSKQIAEQVDLLATSIGASSSYTTVGSSFSMSGLTDNFDKWFALGVDIFLHPSFPADEWAKLKQRQLLGLKNQRTQPSFLASERFNKVVFEMCIRDRMSIAVDRPMKFFSGLMRKSRPRSGPSTHTSHPTIGSTRRSSALSFMP